ncbi:MAG: histidine kinase [Bacteroidales bacterium]|nr:histidine kinase [Bacteroidales bacterium]MCF8404050.1 histidine kinase [Bacteroidales bacterium]
MFLLFYVSLFSQEYSYRHYTVKDGLIQNQVISMFQDSRGYLWLGTKGGVSRFDGLKFQNYTVNDGLLSNLVRRFYEDENGGIYFCSLNGISKLYKGVLNTVLLNDTLPQDKNTLIIPHLSKTDFCVLNKNRLATYIGPYDSVLIQKLSGFVDLEIGSIVEEKAYNKYWLRGEENGLFSIENDSIVYFNKKMRTGFVKDKSGGIYSFYENTLYQPDTTNFTFNDLYHFPTEESVTLYDFDQSKNAYLVSGQKKILVFNGKEVEEYKKKFNFINRLLIDREDNLWIATERGFYKKISDVFENFTKETGANEYVWSIVEDEQKNIWFASYGDGLSKFDGENILDIRDYKTAYSYMQGDFFYTGAILATNHNLYFPVKNSGILKFDGSLFSTLPEMPKGSVLDVYEDSLNKRLMVASTAGLVMLENYQSPIIYDSGFIEPKSYIKTIAQDRSGRYWLGGDYMLCIFDGQQFINFPNKQYDYNAGAISIFYDNRENLWIGTSSGLYFYDYNEFRKVARHDLKSQVVSFVELDSTKLLMGISEGLAIFNLEKFYQNWEESLTILDESRGFLGFDCIRNGILKDSENNIWVAASDRVVKFYPDRLKPDTLEPKIVIQKITASGEKADSTMAFYINEITDSVIKLPYFMKNIRLDFNSIHFYAPEKISYKFKLKGYNDNWSGPTSERYVSYTNLSHGKYRFEVIAENADGVRSKIPASFLFEIVPAFWQTLTFRVIVNLVILLALIFTIYIVWSLRNRRKRQIEETEKQISELQLKTIRSQMDPHFTFNALNSISSVIYKEDKEKAYRYFTKFSKLVRSSLEASDKISRTLEEEIDFTRNYLELEKIRFRDQFIFTINVQDGVNLETVVPKMIIHNYAENAVKHGLKHKSENRRLKIEIYSLDNILKVIIEDNGIGRKQAEILSENTTGKGLKIMNNIYDLYFNLYKVRIEQNIEDLMDDSGNSVGTKVGLKIPVLK